MDVIGNKCMNANEMFDVTGETAIVTGAAQGLGEHMARGLAEAGADVVIADMNLDGAERVAEAIGKIGRASVALEVDVSKVHAVERMVKETVAQFGKVDILINNAGMSTDVPAERMEMKDWRRVLDVNLDGTFLCSQRAGQEMIKRKKGNIINIASMSALIINKPQRNAHYHAAKAGVVMLTKALAAEWARYGIRVNAILPGYMATPDVATRLLPELGERFASSTPIGRVGNPDEMKGPALFLASRASSFVTGCALVVDGGFTLW